MATVLFFKPCMDSTIDSKVRFHICYFTNKKVFSIRTHSACTLFYPINSIVAYPLNENKPQW